ncbi:MAG: DinB family protein [Chloroflexota bacterium]
MSDLMKVQRRHIALIEKTRDILIALLSEVSQETATTLRDPNDGEKGWTALEVLCHLRDFDGYFRGRAEMMVALDNPSLPAYDHEAIALEKKYNEQTLSTVMDELIRSRQQTLTFFKGLSDAEWNRAGMHPENGPWSMHDAIMQVGHHDVTHIEQISRILVQFRK